ncbi:MAG: glycosyltransferase family 39 protein [Candidatus Omnitrophota bacterium]|jgi:hypothetical protein
MKKILLISVVIAAAALFIFFESSPSLRAPIIQGDEAFTGYTALLLVKNMPDGMGVSLFGRNLPLSTVPRHGALECYILAPFLFFGGVTPEALRTGPLIFGALSVIFTYLFTSRFFNPWVGALAAVLLAINGFFISIIKMGGMCGFSTLIFSLTPLLLFLKFSRSKNNLYFYLAMLILGLGVNTRGYFIWFIIALFLTGLLLYRRHLNIKICSIGLTCLFIGALPVLYHYSRINFMHDFVLPNLLVAKEENVNNLDLLANLLRRGEHLSEVLAGRLYDGWQGHSGPVYIFWVCATFIFYRLFAWRKPDFPTRKIVFILSLTAFMFIISNFTLSTLNSGHFILMFPYIQILTAVAIWEIYKSGKLGQKFALFITILLIGLHLNNSISRTGELRKEEQLNINNNIYAVTQWLVDNNVKEAVLQEEPFCQGVQFLSDLKLSASAFRRHNCYLPEQSIYSSMKDAGHEAVFVLENDANSNTQRINKYFKIYAKKLQKEIIIAKQFYKSDGSPGFTAYRLK